MTFKMDTNVLLFVGLLFVAIPEVRSDCFENAECGCIPDGGAGSAYPMQPMKWSTFEKLFFEDQTLEYREVYNLKPPGTRPDLYTLTVQWLKLENGMYNNAVTGWYEEFGFCFDTSINFTVDGRLRYHEPVSFTFTSPLESIPNIGTLFSSCPERYLINWYCPQPSYYGGICHEGLQMSITSVTGPENLPWHLVARDLCRNGIPNIDDPRCDGLQMSITSVTGPENVPWHLVARDLCRNGIPNIDDPRWFFTYSGQHCELGGNPLFRRKRDIESFRMPQWP